LWLALFSETMEKNVCLQERFDYIARLAVSGRSLSVSGASDLKRRAAQRRLAERGPHFLRATETGKLS
jgi:hypothetical protein